MPKQNSRDKILSAATRAIYTGGYHATSVDRITAAAGTPKGSFYNHFRSKEELAVAALDKYFSEHRRYLDELLLENTGRPLQRLRGYFAQVSKLLQEGEFTRGCMLGNLGLEVSDHSDLLRRHLAQLLAELTGAVERCLQLAQECGEISADEDVRALAEVTVNSWEGAILRMKVDKSARPLRLFQEFLFDKLLRRAF
jgi:TetR/AcrR family transcriptional repressor of nem operon